MDQQVFESYVFLNLVVVYDLDVRCEKKEKQKLKFGERLDKGLAWLDGGQRVEAWTIETSERAPHRVAKPLSN